MIMQLLCVCFFKDYIVKYKLLVSSAVQIIKCYLAKRSADKKLK